MYSENKFDKDYSCCPPVCHETGNTTEIEEMIDVAVPVTVAPEVEVGYVTVNVIGEPCVRPIPCVNLPRNGICKFLVTQKLCVQVPITFKASADTSNKLVTDCFVNKYSGKY
ncbi:MAG TPA: hypothetical protein GX396_10490 [Tissierellia bacterium]|jgi:hypothetical protein|nr:hypothetical protein [Tissierellia bacterium]